MRCLSTMDANQLVVAGSTHVHGPIALLVFVQCFAFSSLLNCVFHVSTAPTLMMILEYHYNCLNKFGFLARM